jgi:hypothetical protein
MTIQHTRPRDVAELLARHKIPQSTLGEFGGISQTAISLFLSGQKGMGLNAQLRMLKALQWLVKLARESELPVDFSDVEKLRPLWLRHLRTESEAQLVELNANEQQQAP